MPGAGRPGGGGGGQSHVPAGATSPARSAGRAARSPSSSRPGAHRSHAAGARTPGGTRWALRTRGTGPESCKLCAGLARRGSRSAPGRSRRVAANRAPGDSGGAEGGVSDRRSPGQRAALFTAGPPSLPLQPAPCALLTSFILALSPALSCSQP